MYISTHITHCSSKFHSNKLKQDSYIRLANYIHPRRRFNHVHGKVKKRERGIQIERQPKKKLEERDNVQREHFAKLKIRTFCQTKSKKKMEMEKRFRSKA